MLHNKSVLVGWIWTVVPIVHVVVVVVVVFLVPFHARVDARTLRALAGSENEWYQTNGPSRLEDIQDGILWSPVKKDTTTHRYFEPQPFAHPADVVTVSMTWESDGRDASYKDFNCAATSLAAQGGVDPNFLRCLGGNGDFRIGFFESTRKVEYVSDEKSFFDYKGFHVRLQPHLSGGFASRPANVVWGGETHENIALWTRVRSGNDGLLRQTCAQECGYVPSSVSAFGPNVPLGEPTQLTFRIKRLSHQHYSVTVILHGRIIEMHGEFADDFNPKTLDTIAVYYPNDLRKYSYVKIRDFQVETSVAPTPAPAPASTPAPLPRTFTPTPAPVSVVTSKPLVSTPAPAAASVPVPGTSPSLAGIVSDAPAGHLNGWYKSKSKSKIVALGNGIRWSPVEKPTTLHRYFNPIDFRVGKKIRVSMKWKTDGENDDAKREFDCGKANPTQQGLGIADRHLRCLAGTGDFRIGFFQSNVKVGGETCEGNEKRQTCEKKERINEAFDDYKGFQVRIEPHVSASFKNLPGRLIEDRTGEPHNNLALWTRIQEGEHGLMSDQCQEIDHCGFSKSDGWGTQPTSFGPNAPFGKQYNVVVVINRVSETEFIATVTVHDDTNVLKGKFETKFKPEHIDMIGITYTNSSRAYQYVELEDLSIENIQ